MSTLNVQTIQTNSSGFNNVVTFAQSQGVENGTLCRLWVRFNGTGTVAINDDFNVNTIGDSGTGNYTVNFSNALPNANYAALATGTAGQTSGGTATMDTTQFQGNGTNTSSTTSFNIRAVQGSGSNTDMEWVNAAVFSSY